MTTIGEKIRAIRLANGLTQKELAQTAGIGESALRGYELDTRMPGKMTREKIAIALSIQPEDLENLVITKGSHRSARDLCRLTICARPGESSKTKCRSARLYLTKEAVSILALPENDSLDLIVNKTTKALALTGNEAGSSKLLKGGKKSMRDSVSIRGSVIEALGVTDSSTTIYYSYRELEGFLILVKEDEIIRAR